MSERDAEPRPTQPAAGGAPPSARQLADSLGASLSQQVELLAGELRTRWRRGDRRPIEALGAGYEQVAAHPEQLLDLIYHEILLREEFGERPQLAEYAARFPSQTERLERLFTVHGAIESEWADDDAVSPAPDDDRAAAPPRPASTTWDEQPPPSGRRWPRRPRPLALDAPPGYELQDELGRGGMAVVFRARQQKLDRIVALKMILGGSITSPEVLARFEQEARAVAQLQHPGIVQIYEVGDHRGLPFLALEFVPGGTLHDWLRGQPLAAVPAARLLEQLARTTHFAHERGVIHRDLKPANILLVHRPEDPRADSTLASNSSSSIDRQERSDLVAKIADFGLARILGSGSDLTVTGQVIGTPSYMAPEQARAGGDDAPRPAQDVYSLGAILFELLTGHPPFRGATLLDTLDQVRNDEPVPPRRLQPRVPRDLETICLKCLEKSPERRYPTALALAEDLQRFLKGEAIAARPVRAPERVWKWVRRSPLVASLAAAALLFAVVGIAGTLDGARRARRNERQAQRDKEQAERLRDVAKAQRDEAERERAAADAERARAVAARAEAEASFRSALAAVNALTLLGLQLRAEPRQQAASRRIFDETLRFYEGFLTTRSEDPTLKYLAAGALVQAGNLRGDMGERDKALELLNRAAELLADLRARHPASVAFLRTTAHIHWLRGNQLRLSQQTEAADQAYRDCLAVHDEILALHPRDPTSLAGKANAIVNRCVVLQQLRRPIDALEQYAAAAEILRQLVAAQPQNLHAQSELALCLDDFGRTLGSAGEAAAGEPLQREALALRERLQSLQPNAAMYRILLARSYSSVARCEAQRGEFASADEMLNQGAALLEPLLQDYPEIYEYYAELHGVYVERLRLAVRRKGVTAVQAEWQKLRDLIDRAHARFPEDKFFAERRLLGYLSYASLLWDAPEAQGLLQLRREFTPHFGDLPNLGADTAPSDRAPP